MKADSVELNMIDINKGVEIVEASQVKQFNQKWEFMLEWRTNTGGLEHFTNYMASDKISSVLCLIARCNY